MGFQNNAVVIREGLDEKLASWLASCVALCNADNERNWPDLFAKEHIVFDCRMGDRYAKVFRYTENRATGERFHGSIHAFIDLGNGDVLKPAGVKQPAKKARGNLFDDLNGMGQIGPYGVINTR